jgi:predicted DsbA family dithiol-disulfide isomerase
MHDLLFGFSAKPAPVAPAPSDAPDAPALDRAALEGYARKLGLDLNRFRKALDEATHEPAITRDVTLATAHGIRGTPAFVINGYFVSGAQPLSVFRRAVRRALADQKSKPAGSHG